MDTAREFHVTQIYLLGKKDVLLDMFVSETIVIPSVVTQLILMAGFVVTDIFV
jgi:hypothetical protein